MPLIVTAVSNGLYFHNTSRKLELQDLLEFSKGACDSKKNPKNKSIWHWLGLLRALLPNVSLNSPCLDVGQQIKAAIVKTTCL